MPFATPSLVGVVAAAVAAMAVGFVWYHPKVFGNTWMNLTGKKMGEMGNPSTGYTITFIGSLVMSYVLGSIIKYYGGDLMTALTVAFWLWLGLILTTNLAKSVFNNAPWNLVYLQAGHDLVATLVMSAVLFYWA